MDIDLNYCNQATLEELFALHGLGYEFVIEDGRITNVLHG